MSFPLNPIDGQSHTNNLGTRYIYSSVRASWIIASREIQGATGSDGVTGLRGVTGLGGMTGSGGMTGMSYLASTTKVFETGLLYAPEQNTMRLDTTDPSLSEEIVVNGLDGVGDPVLSERFFASIGDYDLVRLENSNGDFNYYQVIMVNKNEGPDPLYTVQVKHVIIYPGYATDNLGYASWDPPALTHIAAMGITGLEGTTGSVGDTGLIGPTGVQGYTGTAGVTGIIGLTGLIGPTGLQGYTGPQGHTGSQGVTGLIGITGLIGFTGVHGYTGSQGLTGSQGYTGPQGLTGLIGITGLQNVTGIQGQTGTQGYTGSQGVTGLSGVTGLIGLTGYQGYTGAQGVTGLLGLTGSQGLTGAQGQGITGLFGATGLQGVTGAQGLTGAQGNTGVHGVTGFIGLTGAQGYTGAQGITGVVGVTGLAGFTGLIGLTGSQGTTGLVNFLDIPTFPAVGVTPILLWNEVDEALYAGVTGVGHWVQISSGSLQGATGAQVPISYQFYADQLDTPVTPNWAVTGMAPANVDSLNSALLVRRFDDTAEEGVGFALELPNSASNIEIAPRARAETAPGGARQVILKLYNRDISDNAAVGAWSAGTTLTAIDIPTNAYFQYDSQTISFTTLGLTAGRITQFELTRNGADGNDSLVGDWSLLYIKITFT